MTQRLPRTIVAVTGDEARYETVLERASTLGKESRATVILYDRPTDLSPFESPMPTDWSGDGEKEQFGNRLDLNDLEAAGQSALADRVRAVRAAGVEAYGWLPPKNDPSALAEYVADQHADVVLVSSEDDELIEALRAESFLGVEAVSPATPTT